MRKPDAKFAGMFRGKMVLDPNPGKFGPAMKALSERHRKFVIDFLANGGRNASEAYRQAGYTSSNTDTIKANAWRLLHDPRTQAAILEETKKRVTGSGPFAIETLIQMLDSPSITAKDRIRCAELLLNRGGFHAQTEHKVSVEHTLNTSELADKIKTLSAELGLDADRFLGDQTMIALPPPEIEADFETVEAEDDISDIL